MSDGVLQERKGEKFAEKETKSVGHVFALFPKGFCFDIKVLIHGAGGSLHRHTGPDS